MTAKPLQIMTIAGETSGDTLAAELLRHLRKEITARGAPSPVCFGAGGARMAAAGVELAVDMTAHSVIGLWEALRHYFKFRRIFNQLLELAVVRRPDLVLCVDFSGFNRRFGHAVKAQARSLASGDWQPQLVQYVSPQVWASRPGRARKMSADFDLLLSIFPFEKAWYTRQVPDFRVEFVGHPIFDRYPQLPQVARAEEKPLVLLLPGSRVSELRRHLTPMLGAWRIIQNQQPAARAVMVLPNETLLAQARDLATGSRITMQVGSLPERLREATVAIASTGTVTVECAFFGAPTVTLYRTSWPTYWIARQIVKVNYLAMPNILADAPVFPEFIQAAVTPENLARAALELLSQPAKRRKIQQQLRQIVASLGGPGAARRAAQQIAALLEEKTAR